LSLRGVDVFITTSMNLGAAALNLAQILVASA
jgi:hypothetical protein